MHNGNSGFLIRRLKRRDREDLISNYYALYDEVKHNPSLGIPLLRRRPSINEEYKWFTGMLSKERKGEAIISVAEAEGKVVGMCDITKYSPRVEQSHVGTVGILINYSPRKPIISMVG